MNANLSASSLRPSRRHPAPSVLPLLAVSLLLFLCSFALGRVPAPWLGAAQALLISAQVLLVAGVLRLRRLP